MENDNKRCLFNFSPRVAEAFVLELTEVTFGCVAHAWKTEIMQILLSEVLCVCVKDTKQKRFLRSFRKAASWIDRNQGAICENIWCTTESMAESIDCAPAKPSPPKRRCFQMFKKVHHEKWSFATIDKKGDTCMNSQVHSSAVKWLNWWTVECDRQTAFSAARNR